MTQELLLMTVMLYVQATYAYLRLLKVYVTYAY